MRYITLALAGLILAATPSFAQEFPLIDYNFSCMKNYTSMGSIKALIKAMEARENERGNKMTIFWRGINDDRYRLDFVIDDKMTEKRETIKMGFVKNGDNKAILYYISAEGVPGLAQGAPGYRDHDEDRFDDICASFKKMAQ